MRPNADQRIQDYGGVCWRQLARYSLRASMGLAMIGRRLHGL